MSVAVKFGPHGPVVHSLTNFASIVDYVTKSNADAYTRATLTVDGDQRIGWVDVAWGSEKHDSIIITPYKFPAGKDGTAERANWYEHVKCVHEGANKLILTHDGSYIIRKWYKDDEPCVGHENYNKENGVEITICFGVHEHDDVGAYVRYVFFEGKTCLMTPAAWGPVRM